MSPLTKILIVLLTVASIFLCGIVVTYVASADDYKEQSQKLNSQLQTAKQKEASTRKELDEKQAKFLQERKRLEEQITAMKTELTEVKNQLASSEREKAALLQEAGKWKAITKDFQATNDKQGELLKNTLEELEELRAEQIKLNKNYNETSQTLIEKMAILKTLETKMKRLQEENAELQDRLGQPLLPFGKKAAPAVPVTPEIPPREPVMPVIKDIDLKGLVKAVNIKNSMASISLGRVDGVKEGMTFHVTRGDEFICDIRIISVDTEEAVGVIDLVQQIPRVGDNAATNF